MQLAMKYNLQSDTRLHLKSHLHPNLLEANVDLHRIPLFSLHPRARARRPPTAGQVLRDPELEGSGRRILRPGIPIPIPCMHRVAKPCGQTLTLLLNLFLSRVFPGRSNNTAMIFQGARVHRTTCRIQHYKQFGIQSFN